MHQFQRLLICIIFLAPMTLQSLKISTPIPISCPVTPPVEERPDPAIDPFEDDALLIHENGLWVTVPEFGVIELAPEDEIQIGPATGWRSMDVTWLRDEGIEGFIEVTGERLDEKSDESPRTPLSPQRQYVRVGTVHTGMAFPSNGCWKVTGSAGESSVTFIVDVRFVNSEATPVP